MPLRAVAFDVDGTLYPNASMYLHSLGLALTNARLLRSLERVRMQLRAAPETEGDFHRIQARMVGADLGIPADRAYERIEDRVYTRWYRIFRKLRPFAGLQDAIDAFRHHGLKIAILSDFPIGDRLDHLGLQGPWDCAFSSEETGYLKPHPRSFEVLAQRLSLPPAEILYVGNSHTYDVLGARAAGMPCAHLTAKPRPDSQALFSFSRYEQLKEFVLRTRDDLQYNGETGRVPC